MAGGGKGRRVIMTETILITKDLKDGSYRTEITSTTSVDKNAGVPVTAAAKKKMINLF